MSAAAAPCSLITAKIPPNLPAPHLPWEELFFHNIHYANQKHTRKLLILPNATSFECISFTYTQYTFSNYSHKFISVKNALQINKSACKALFCAETQEKDAALKAGLAL